MAQTRKLDPTVLLFWEAQGIRPLEMQSRLAAQGITVSVDLIRLRVREARQQAAGEPPKPAPAKKSSATARRQRTLDEAAHLLEGLEKDLRAVLDSWGDSFSGTDRYERFSAAAGELEALIESLRELSDAVAWNG